MREMETLEMILSQTQDIRTRKLIVSAGQHLARVSEIVSNVLGMGLLILTVYRLPQTLGRIQDFYVIQNQVLERERIWHCGSRILFQKLPPELIGDILKHLDLTSLVRLGATCSQLRTNVLHKSVWIDRILREWPEYDINTALDTLVTRYRKIVPFESIEQYASAYALFKMRWCAIPRPKTNTSSPLIFLADLSYYATDQLTYHGLHLFLFANVLCGIILVLDECSLFFSNVHLGIISLWQWLSPANLIGRSHSNTRERWIELLWTWLWIPVLALVHLQFVILPWSVFNQRYLLDIPFLAQHLSYLQKWSLIWRDLAGPHASRLAIVICAVEELSFHYSRTSRRSNWVLMGFHKCIGTFTICLQCALGIIIYVTLFILSSVHQTRRVRYGH
ncbi:hypothetical protein EDD86DRAFT_248692 [Gorgonomyces haynaldii]|nr:hypothetical protein EDD86DRAFT_248692 [Gorgonomyces haynaldii]